MKRALLCCALLVGVFYSLRAQTISGTVTEAESGDPLPGVAVTFKGTTIGAFTDSEGRYAIDLAGDATILQFNFIGFKVIEEIINGRSTINVQMEEDILSLEEVVVTGYTAQKRKALTGAVSSVKADEIANVQLPSLETALQGRAAGVQVVKNSGKPGGGIDVNIRGRTSITASNQPLYVVDGIPLIGNDGFDFAQEGIGGSNISVLADLNPEEIESIEVLKDAATAAVYGSRAANGVVLITTKSGNVSGKTQVNVNTSYGGQWAPNKIEGITGQEYQQYITEIFAPLLEGAFGVEPSYQNVQDLLLGPLGNANTQWLDEIFTTGTMRDVNASISGGNTKTQFFASGGWNDEGGIIRNSSFERFSGRLNVKHQASEKLRFNMNMGYTNSNTQQVQNDNNIFGALGAAILIPPVVPIFNPDGSFGSAFGIENAVAAVTVYENNIKRGRLIGRVGATYNFLDNLSLTASLGVDLLNQRETIYEPRTLQSSNNGRGIVATVANDRFIHDYVLNFNETLFGGSISAYAGLSFQEDAINSTFAEAVNFPTDAFTGLSSGAESVTTDGEFTGDNLQSYFGGFNYNLNDKYFVTATFRVDGSSRFVNDQFGYFPGFSVGWNLAEESFLENGPFDLLKVRFGWGQTGNNVIGNFDSRQLFDGGNNYRDLPGTAPAQIGNADLKWETTTQTNLGFDFTFLNERINASIDLYQKDTDDLLLDRPIPTTSGFLSVLQNVGEVRNRGIDVAITTANFVQPNFRWSTTFTLGYLENEVVRLVDGIPFAAGFGNRIQEGYSIGSFFGHQTDGIFQNQAEVDAHATQPGAAPGDIRFKDLAGGVGEDGILLTDDDLPADGVINDDDRTILGKALPDFMGGIVNDLSIYGVEINAFFQFATGFKIYNNNNVFAEGLNGVFSPTRRAWENRWQQEGDQTEIPRLIRNDPNNNRRDSDRFIEDGDYIRLKTLTVGYNLPSSIVSALGIRSLKIYASGYNLWTLTNYSWFDPEVNMFDGDNLALGTDFLTYPQPRSIVGGINLGL